MKNFLFAFLLLNFIIFSASAELAVYFNRDCEKIIIDQINNAQKRTSKSRYSLLRDSQLPELIKAKQRKKLKLKLYWIFIRLIVSMATKIYRLLYQNKIDVVTVKKTEGSHMHHKFTVIDDETVINGSFNYTTNAVKFNDENITVSKDKQFASKFISEWDKLKKKKKAQIN